MGSEFRLVSQEFCILRPASSVALLYYQKFPSKTVKQGVLRYGQLFSISYSTIAKTLILAEGPLLIIPQWARVFFGLKEDDYAAIEFIEEDAVPALRATVRLLTKCPSAIDWKAALHGLAVCQGFVFTVVASGLNIPCVVSSVEGAEEARLFECTDETEIIIETLQRSASETDSSLQLVYAEDIKNFMLIFDATNLHIDVDDTPKPCVFFISYPQYRVLTPFIETLRSRFREEEITSVDFYGIATEDELEEASSKIDTRIRAIVEWLKQSQFKLLILSRLSRFTSQASIDHVCNFMRMLRAALPDINVLVADVKAPKRLIKLLSRSSHFQTAEFEPSPLSHASRMIYLEQSIGKREKLEELRASKWRMAGFGLEELDELVESANNGSSDICSLIDTLQAGNKVQYIRMMDKGLSSWDRIQGYKKPIEKLRTMLYGPWESRELFAKFGITRSPNILLHGPSGCGKTSVVRALANDGVFNVLEIDMARLKSKYLGETEEHLRHAFSLARQNSPCILFIDEIDGLGKRRDLASGESDSGGAEERLLSTLLNEMDGVEDLGDVIVIGCTSKLGAIDSALKRPGRLDLHIELGLPSDEDRKDIITSRLNAMNIQAHEEQVTTFVSRTSGQSCAEIIQIFQEAGHRAIMQNINNPLISFDELL